MKDGERKWKLSIDGNLIFAGLLIVFGAFTFVGIAWAEAYESVHACPPCPCEAAK